jgi:hypothetical protein
MGKRGCPGDGRTSAAVRQYGGKLKSKASGSSKKASAPTEGSAGVLKNTKGTNLEGVCEGADMVESKISFDENINLGHVLCYDIACAVWIVQQNCGSTKGKRGQKKKKDGCFTSKERNRGYSKRGIIFHFMRYIIAGT